MSRRYTSGRALREQQNPIEKAFVVQCFGLVTGDFRGRFLHRCPAPRFQKLDRPALPIECALEIGGYIMMTLKDFL